MLLAILLDPINVGRYNSRRVLCNHIGYAIEPLLNALPSSLLKLEFDSIITSFLHYSVFYLYLLVVIHYYLLISYITDCEPEVNEVKRLGAALVKFTSLTHLALRMGEVVVKEIWRSIIEA